MSDYQEWCREISEVAMAASRGEKIQAQYDGGPWFEKGDSDFEIGCKYRIKPRTIKIGDFDVPEPMRDEPEFRSMVYCVALTLDFEALCMEWVGSKADKIRLSRGMIHSSKEAAKIHAGAIFSLTAAK